MPTVRERNDNGQTALVLVVAFTMLLSVIGAVMVSLTLNNSPLLSRADTQRFAYRALASGLNSYQSAINANPYLASCNSQTNTGAANAKAACASISYGTWSLVPGTDIGGGVIPEFYKFDNPQQVKDPTTGALLYLEVQVVGSAGFGTHISYYSTLAKFVPANGFLNNLFWDNYQSSSTPPTANCNYYYWNNNYSNSGTCSGVYFEASEVLDGPVFSNDSLFLSGAPTFGSGSTLYGATTADPHCLFRTDGSSALSCSTLSSSNYNVSQSSFGPSNFEPIPTDNTELANYALRGGCYYQGPTTITLNGSTINVVSKDTPGYPGTATTNYSGNTSVCPTNGSGSLPANGVAFVDQATTVTTGANPFDGTGQTCSGKTPCAQTKATCPNCYYGQTSTPDSEADAFVSGHLSGQLTIGSKNNIEITNDITYDDCTWTGTASQSTCAYNSVAGTSPNDSLGLIAYNYVSVNRPLVPSTSPSTSSVLPYCTDTGALPPPLCNPANGSNGGIVIDASILALQQSFGVNNPGNTGNDGYLTIYGSIQQDSRGIVGQNGHAYLKYYTWDPRLALYSPPYYLSPGTASWALTSSAESYCGAQPLIPPVANTPTKVQPIYPACGALASQVMSSAAFTADGCSGTYSAATSTWASCGWTTGADSSALVPSAPTGVTATAGNSQASVSWSVPSTNGGSVITGYTVTASGGGGSCTTTGTSCTVTGLTNGVSYTFTVTAANAVGTGPASSASNSVTPVGPPGPPTGVTATAGNGQATVSWSAPSSNGGSAITGYSVTSTPTVTPPASCTNTTSLTCTFTGLTAGTSYTFTVTATNSAGTSSNSAASSPVTPTGVPGAPGTPTATLVSNTANGSSPSLTVTWTAPSSTGGLPITGYVVSYASGGTGTTSGTACPSQTALTCTVSGLTAGKSYVFTVKATNSAGTGSSSGASTAVTAATVPGVPTGLGGSGGTTGAPVTFTATWTAPSSNGGSTVNNYTVTYYLGASCSGPSAGTFTTASATTSAIVSTGLSAGKKYYFNVYASNADGNGATSACYTTGLTAN